MYRFYLAGVDMLPGAVLLAPVYYILNKKYFHSTKKKPSIEDEEEKG